MISCMSARSAAARCGCSGMDPADRRAGDPGPYGLVPQEDSLDLELTVLDNLMIYGRYFDMPRKVDPRSGPSELLDFAQLTERANDRVDPLSGGMKRRLTIARALISEPDLLHPRRAHDRPRPPGPPPAVGPALPAEAAGRDPGDHHALHGRGRAAVRPPGGDGQGSLRRRGHAPRS